MKIGATPSSFMNIKKILSLSICLSLIFLSCESKSIVPQDRKALDLVASKISRNNEFGITGSDLESSANMKGEGSFVFSENLRQKKKHFKIAWFVLDKRVYAINRLTKEITPSVTLLAKISFKRWEKTNLVLKDIILIFEN